ncbi:HD domain-containing protein [Kibdelosporangium aridum]|uniref:HD domain-containing protein n=1 Tax=Kibdelosporangium aridum TaxID=2030 RepID=UPI000527F7FB
MGQHRGTLRGNTRAHAIILRQSPLAAAQRRENDAEHSWRLAMMVIILTEHTDIGRTRGNAS